MVNNLSQVVMYVLMRTDMKSITPGRACAQATHAANECVKYIKENPESYTFQHLLPEWESETGYFGTTIVLGATIEDIEDIFDNLNVGDLKCGAGITHDPTYAVRDGGTTHLIPVNTCMWIFRRKNEVGPYVEHLDLY